MPIINGKAVQTTVMPKRMPSSPEVAVRWFGFRRYLKWKRDIQEISFERKTKYYTSSL